MHIGDVGGMAVDIGFAGIASSLSRLRAYAFRICDLLSGSRYLRGFIVPGGVAFDPDKQLSRAQAALVELKRELVPVMEMFLEDPVVYDRLQNVGRLSRSLAFDFGLVGVAARASGIAYDARQHFAHGVYPEWAPSIVTEAAGDVMARTLVRMKEIDTSISVMERIFSSMGDGPVSVALPDSLPKEEVGVGIVEAFRGELIHLVITDSDGAIRRYAIKDPSINNWTGLAIAVRYNLVSDFPICNKSFSLSYSGDDL
jgi:Ni,Fe-hydrogenase III large subunit